jgi:chromosome segregation protein
LRLTKLKLSGFKSFVDPTAVLLPGQLVGVVGPNGCGKSNIIDAVRWVLGESKAAALRGESMQDVIFNGSTGRKPVGRASVELVFDNSLGRAAGQWSQYSEIAVKRVLERNGDSSYHINNVHVRRRDVIDVFLGTGLGPRAYAIIEQGMISRIIEARPEELRLFLEEAAGITRYKERRRETENRLSDARDNLDRVKDIVTELEHRIGRLEGQAAVAEKYRALQAELTERQNLLWLLKRNEAGGDRDRFARDVERAANKREAETARLRQLERQAEEARSEHYAASDALHAAQSEVFAVNADVARLESELQHLRDGRQRLQTRLSQLSLERAQWQSQLDTSQADQRRWQDLLANAVQRRTLAQSRHEEAAVTLPRAEQRLAETNAAVAALRRELGQAEQQIRVEEAHRTSATRALETLAQRRTRLTEERTALHAPDAAAFETAQAQHAELDEQAGVRQDEVAQMQAHLPELQSANRRAVETDRAAQKQLTELQARRDALLQLQQKVQHNGKLGDWLKRHGLDEAPPLWRALDVEAGWETALEAVLRERLGGTFLPSPEDGRRILDDAPAASVALAMESAACASRPRAERGEPLAAKVRCADPRWQDAVADWLDGICVAEDLGAVIDRRCELAADELWVNRAGQTVGRHAITLYAPDLHTHGVLERQREIDDLQGRLALAQEEGAETRQRVVASEAALARHQDRLAVARREAQDLQARRHAAQLELVKLQQALSRHQERAGQIERDLGEVAGGEQQEYERQGRAEAELARQRELAAALRTKLESALEMHSMSELALREARTSEQALAREMQEAQFSERECGGKLEDVARSQAMAGEQMQRIESEHAVATAEIAVIDEEKVAGDLQAMLELRREQEQRLAASRQGLEEIAARLRQFEESRLKVEQGLPPLRERIGDLRLKEQAARMSEEQYAARLTEAAADTDLLSGKLSRETRESTLQDDLARIGQEIADLGAVNLAALEELTASQERKDYLEAQSLDLTQAIGTLEDAIRRIDRETREQLRTTYDKVNEHFGVLFPQLFGGGEARLVLTGEEILDAGVQVVAQPPGKKNASIHLLSGGEKALTAIALVFSFFQLNPAPFCLLDEVDAPLDDSNTERFCDMVKRMSQQTQFLFISHNKITMEMAQQLIGVTMQEQGVSRVVEVDIEQALRLQQEAAA